MCIEPFLRSPPNWAIPETHGKLWCHISYKIIYCTLYTIHWYNLLVNIYIYNPITIECPGPPHPMVWYPTRLWTCGRVYWCGCGGTTTTTGYRYSRVGIPCRGASTHHTGTCKHLRVRNTYHISQDVPNRYLIYILYLHTYVRATTPLELRPSRTFPLSSPNTDWQTSPRQKGGIATNEAVWQLWTGHIKNCRVLSWCWVVAP